MTLLSSVTIYFGLFLASFLGTKLYIGYARKNAILDIPNMRSSHTIPTPRGGGIVFVSLFLLSICFFALSYPQQAPLWSSLLGGGTLIATIGWIDDRKNLPARTRLLVHALAVLWTLFNNGGLPSLFMGKYHVSLGAFGYVLGLIGGIWLINLYNFMDGVDGLAAGEAVLVASAGAFLTLGTSTSFALFTLAALVLGFLLWNWSPAKVFMGDTGSGFLGFAFFCFALYSENTNTMSLLVWAVLISVFVVDATLTLIMRARQRKRLSEAHRDHLYHQFLKAGFKHAAVTTSTLSLSFCISLATFFLSQFVFLLFIATYGLLGVIWMLLYYRFSSGAREREGRVT
jgi:Fuc2NAc and GlcNAc transferase